MKKKNLTSKSDLAFFKERCLFWQKELGLINWGVVFTHEETDNRAQTGYVVSGASATINLSTDWGDDKIDQESLNRTAFHEVLHLLLAPLVCESMVFYNAKYIDGLEHAIIQTFTNLYLNKL